MPFYEYKCAKCDEIVEFRSSFEKKQEMVASLKCENCGSTEFVQVFNGLAFSGSKIEKSTPPTAGGCCPGGMCNI